MREVEALGEAEGPLQSERLRMPEGKGAAPSQPRVVDRDPAQGPLRLSMPSRTTGIVPVAWAMPCSIAAGPLPGSGVAPSPFQPVTTRRTSSSSRIASTASRLTTPGLAPIPTIARTPARAAAAERSSIATVGSGSSQRSR